MHKKWQGKPKEKTSSFYKAFGYVVAAIGLAASIVTFLPRITVDAGAQIDPGRPYPIPFTITNTGVVSLTSVQPAIGLCSFWTELSTQSSACEKIGVRFLNPQWFVHELRKDEKHVIRLDDLFRVSSPARFGGADISIVISYYPWLIPIKREIEFRFVTRKEMDGMLSWVPQPLGK
jgi:hypothetical protein